MWEENKIDNVLRKAKTAAPVMTMTEVDQLLRAPRPKKLIKAWYVPGALMTILLLLSWSVYEPTPDRLIAKKISGNVYHFIPSAAPIKKTEETATKTQRPARKSVVLTSSTQPVTPTPEIRSVETKDTTSKKEKVATKAITVKYIEMMIPWFADQEALKIYHDKLASEGITFTITELRYEDKTQRGSKVSGKRIVYIKADIYINNQFYKTIQATNFKELRIGWETDSAGMVRIKSLNYLDRNYMSRKL